MSAYTLDNTIQFRKEIKRILRNKPPLPSKLENRVRYSKKITA